MYTPLADWLRIAGLAFRRSPLSTSPVYLSTLWRAGNWFQTSSGRSFLARSFSAAATGCIVRCQQCRYHTSGAMSRWSDQQTSRFMRIYRDNEHLWNVRHPHYRSRALRRDSLRKFVQALRIPDFTVGDVVKKIKSLRSTYYLEMKKIANSGVDAGGAPLYTPSMNWFREMDDIMKLVKELEVSTKSVNNREFSPPNYAIPY